MLFFCTFVPRHPLPPLLSPRYAIELGRWRSGSTSRSCVSLLSPAFQQQPHRAEPPEAYGPSLQRQKERRNERVRVRERGVEKREISGKKGRERGKKKRHKKGKRVKMKTDKDREQEGEKERHRRG